MKGFLIFCLAIPLCLGFIGCGNDAEKSSSAAKQSEQESGIELPDDYFD